MSHTDKPAMQVQGVFSVSARIHHEPMAHEATLRDYFAAQAMQGICSNDSGIRMTIELIAAEAYEIADAMLEARKEQT